MYNHIKLYGNLKVLLITKIPLQRDKFYRCLEMINFIVRNAFKYIWYAPLAVANKVIITVIKRGRQCKAGRECCTVSV